jgi:hypothetical protein
LLAVRLEVDMGVDEHRADHCSRWRALPCAASSGIIGP